MKSHNFMFLEKYFPSLTELGAISEAIIYADAGSSITRLRTFAEEVTRSIYSLESLQREPKASFYEILFAPSFQSIITRSLFFKIDYLRRQGNLTAHGAIGDIETAFKCLEAAYDIGLYLVVHYHQADIADIPIFKQFAKSDVVDSDLKNQIEQNQKLCEELERERLKNHRNHKISIENAQEKQKLSQYSANSLNWSEANTRKFMIDTMLLSAGWSLSDYEQVKIEVPVKMKDGSFGYVDYVFYDTNGQPLAILEAKKTSRSVQDGREQARAYADALEMMGFKRPVIFYSNGYETFIWDDIRYNSFRQIYGFYSRQSLANLRFKHEYAEKNIERNNPNIDIAGRPYQIEAIKTIARKFQNQGRKALIIQATGTGKTRVSIALSELLIRCKWAQRILFLCDRRELRKQADEAFTEYLGSEPRCVIGKTNKIPTDARVYVGTYPSMMNRFAQFDVGFFDLIIADESHRSIYNRYKDIFDYYDALQVGLTATPVKFISRNTFKMFDCDDTNPTFEFGLGDAIGHEPPYLVPFKVHAFTTEFLREGIHYNHLSDEQKRQLEEDLGEEIAKQTTIAGRQIGKKIFSESTDRLILENLMTNGIRDASGSLVGKTIIFAQRQDHAEHLEQLFCKLYPQYGAKVCKVIHNKIHKVERLIEEFKEPDNQFRIAISIDMLDTGIDVPEVVNLVFAKPVMSWVKFWQMIGRGTRLCPNLFGEGKHKKEFLIFDHYGNFEYFEEEYEEPEDIKAVSLLQSTFEARLNLAKTSVEHQHMDGFEIATHLIKSDINDLPNDSVNVKKHLKKVHMLQQTDLVQRFELDTQHILKSIISPLMDARLLKEKEAIAFDKLIALTQESLILQASYYESYRTQILTEIADLAITIQEVRQKKDLIAEVRTQDYWKAITVQDLENLRLELRYLMKYKRNSGSGKGWATPTTTANDGETTTLVSEIKLTSNDVIVYKRRIKEVLDEMVAKNSILQKIRKQETVDISEMIMLTSTILSSHPNIHIDVLNDFYGRTAEDLYLTIQEIIGLDSEAVELHFQDFLHSHPSLTAKQVQFLNLLQAYISEYGGITIDKLYESPFDKLAPNGLDGIFSPEDVSALVQVLQPFVKKQPSEQRIA
ncbi:DEAD/DEAH box helicase family protein [Acinetobacter oleivorans]|uniref:type I restriction endonuclease subunit R n=1 Tax=Acinetobacter oleivorans TaxID=1148157 RepID=UPI003A8841C8